MREHGVVSPLSERRKQSVSTVRREENNNDNSSSSNGRRRAGGMGVLVFEGKGSAQRPGERVRGGNGFVGGRDHKQQKRKASQPLVAERKGKDEEDEEEENEAKGKPSLASAATITKREDVVMALHWGLKKRARCSRVDESSVLSRKMVRGNAEKVAGDAAGPAVTSMPAQVLEKRAQEWRLKPSNSPAELRNPEGGHRGGGSGGARCGVGTDHDGENGRGGCGVHAAPASPEKQDTISTRHSRNPNSSPIKDVLDHNEAPNLKLELEWPKIILSLSRKEKEEDFVIIKGTKLPQRPKRRSKAVEKSLIYCCPGIWLSDLSRGRYDVREKKCVKKKPRGLKAMESMESDSD